MVIKKSNIYYTKYLINCFSKNLKKGLYNQSLIRNHQFRQMPVLAILGYYTCFLKRFLILLVKMCPLNKPMSVTLGF